MLQTNDQIYMHRGRAPKVYSVIAACAVGDLSAMIFFYSSSYISILLINNRTSLIFKKSDKEMTHAQSTSQSRKNVDVQISISSSQSEGMTG